MSGIMNEKIIFTMPIIYPCKNAVRRTNGNSQLTPLSSSNTRKKVYELNIFDCMYTCNFIIQANVYIGNDGRQWVYHFLHVILHT